MFDDILGPIDYEKQLFRSRLKSHLSDNYSLSIVRVEEVYWNSYTDPPFVFGKCFQTGGKPIKTFIKSLSIFQEFNKTEILLTNLDWDMGYFNVNITWRLYVISFNNVGSCYILVLPYI